MVMMLRLLAVSALIAACTTSDNTNTSCPASCPATWVGVELVVQGSGSAAPSGVSATFTGPQNGAMSCQSNGQGVVLCFWPGAITVTAGMYAVDVAAPGYVSAMFDATVAIDLDPECGCTHASLTPSDVTLDSM
jgi:hypothetical protein